jgi:hypothetical protein
MNGRVVCAEPFNSVRACVECRLALERLTCSFAVLWADSFISFTRTTDIDRCQRECSGHQYLSLAHRALAHSRKIPADRAHTFTQSHRIRGRHARAMREG